MNQEQTTKQAVGWHVIIKAVS